MYKDRSRQRDSNAPFEIAVRCLGPALERFEVFVQAVAKSLYRVKSQSHRTEAFFSSFESSRQGESFLQ